MATTGTPPRPGGGFPEACGRDARAMARTAALAPMAALNPAAASRRAAAILLALGLVLAGLPSVGAGDGGARAARDDAPAEDDWSLPAWVEPSPNSGLYSESAAPEFDVHVRGIDLTWEQ